MLVEVDEVELCEAVEVLEQGEPRFWLALGGGGAQVLDEDAWVDLFLDVDRRCVGSEFVIVGGAVVLAAPDKLRVERGVALITNLLDRLDAGVDEVVRVRGRDVGPFVAVEDLEGTVNSAPDQTVCQLRQSLGGAESASSVPSRAAADETRSVR